MIWPILTISLILIFIYTISWQTYSLGKRIILRDVLMEFREMRYETVELLTDRIVSKKGNSYENKEIYDFVLLATNTIDGFDVVKDQLINFRSYSEIFMSIDGSFKAANTIDLETSELVHAYKARFVRNLLSAFRTIPFFRFRVIALLGIGFLRISVALGLLKMTKNFERLMHVLQTYDSIKKENDQLSYLI
jgi:hypothetical protein